MRWCVVIGICLSAAPAVAQDAPAGAATFFETRIRPVLAARCFKCHGAQKSASGFRLDSRKSLIDGGDRGAAVVAGDPKASLLIQAIRYDGDLKMPPDKRLPAEVVADLERWIADGAVWPETPNRDSQTDTGEHWAFKPIRAVSAPVPPRQ